MKMVKNKQKKLNPIIAHHKKVSVTLSEDLREQNKGDYEGTPKSRIREAMDASDVEFCAFEPKGGESLEVVQERIQEFLAMLQKKHKEDTVLIVSHGGPIALIRMEIEKFDWDEFTEKIPHTCEILTYDL
jgi:broad specificity phosphatase PhoE